MRRKVLLFIGMFIFLTTFSACSFILDKDSDEKGSEGSQISKKIDDVMDRGPVKGGTLKLFSTKPDTLNPLLSNNRYVKDFLGLVFEGLVKIDGKLNAVPVLAEGWNVSDDGLTWTFNIRKNSMWHDNIPLTAEDVVFTFETILKAEVNSSYKTNLDNIITFAAVDKNTFRVVLKTPNSFTAELMTFPIIPKHYFLNEDIVKTARNMKPVGTGPYKFSSYNQNEDVKLIFNDKWWGTKNPDTTLPGLPYIVEVQVKLFEEGRDAINAFQTVDIDLAGMNGVDAAKYKGRLDLMMKKFPGRNFEFLAFNISKPALEDKIVRQAIGYAVDKTKILNDILPGQAVLSDIPVLPGTWLNESVSQYYEPNKEKARELLISNGWKEGNSGFYKYINGVYTSLNLEMLVNDDNEVRIKVANNIADQLSKIGINVHIKKVDWNTALMLTRSKQYDICMMGCLVPQVPDLSFLYASWSTSQWNGSAYNIAGYANPKVDEYLIKLMTENNIVQKKQMFSKIKNEILDDIPYLGLYFYNESMLYNKRIRGDINPNIFDRYNDLTKWYLP